MDDWILMLRGIERIIGVGIGGIAVFLGYRIFLHLPEQNDSQGRVLLPGGVSIYLSRIGPGAFFALFGSIVVAISFGNAVKYDKSWNPGQAQLSAAGGNRSGGTKVSISSVGSHSAQDNSSSVLGIAQLKQDIADLHDALFVLTQENPAKSDLQDIRTRLASRLSQLKLGLMRLNWQSHWGDFEGFRNWLQTEAHSQSPGKAPSRFEEPSKLFFHRME